MWQSTVHWFSLHYLQILIAIGAAVVIYSLLTALRSVGGRLKGHPGDTLGLANVAGRAFARTTHFFMAMVAARLVVSYANRSEEHTSELQSLMRISYAGFCLKKKKK